VTDPGFWAGKSVLVTGHTGFKGTWLAEWLGMLGARVDGLSLPDDVRDFGGGSWDVVFHLAAQSLVRRSFAEPEETWSVNVEGTRRLLERADAGAVVVVTSDKAYAHADRPLGEDDPLGGTGDPYSASKAGQERVAAEIRDARGLRLATARAGNVIGGGDWAADRLVPDFFRAALAGEPFVVRAPGAVRPWQHVLNPLSGYLVLAERLFEGESVAEAWNFGPAPDDVRPVSWVVERLRERWPEALDVRVEPDAEGEAAYLALDSGKARERLGWHPRWDLESGLDATVEWYAADDPAPVTRAQIERFSSS
jgi:CDP-glucose 4,6-dehydratase